MTHYRLIKPEDLESVYSLKLRQADIDEIKASTGHDPVGALLRSVNISERVWVVVHKGKIEGVFGVAPSGTFGVPWFVATDKFSEFRYTFAKESKSLVKEILSGYEALGNFVDSRHEESIRWLRWLGFTIMTDNGFTLYDKAAKFYYFVMFNGKEDDA